MDGGATDLMQDGAESEKGSTLAVDGGPAMATITPTFVRLRETVLVNGHLVAVVRLTWAVNVVLVGIPEYLLVDEFTNQYIPVAASPHIPFPPPPPPPVPLGPVNYVDIRFPLGFTLPELLNLDIPVSDPAITSTTGDFVTAGTYIVILVDTPVDYSFALPGVYTWQAPCSGMATVRAWAGGGGGGGDDPSGGGNGASAGGGGGFAGGSVAITNGVDYQITVGAGGIGGVDASTNGTAGGLSKFKPVSGSDLLRATGGAGGDSAANASPGAYAPGGVGQVGSVLTAGGHGGTTSGAPGGGGGGGGGAGEVEDGGDGADANGDGAPAPGGRPGGLDSGFGGSGEPNSGGGAGPGSPLSAAGGGAQTTRGRLSKGAGGANGKVTISVSLG